MSMARPTRLAGWLLAVSSCLVGNQTWAEVTIGFERLVIEAPDGGRTLDVALWYPTTDTTPSQLIADNPAFIGEWAKPGARPRQGPLPLVVTSHGFGGNWRNQGWLGAKLARRGYLVAAPNHPGTTSRDSSPVHAAELWERARDISRVIDALTDGDSEEQSERARDLVVDTHRIAAVGHSLGGWTVLLLAGARFSPAAFRRDCEQHPSLASCRVYAQIGAGRTARERRRLAEPLTDTRVSAVVSLDLGLARGLTPQSLAAIEIPVLVIAAGDGVHQAQVPPALESGYLTTYLPPATSVAVSLDDASHFSFLGLCKPGAAALLDEESPGDGIICEEGGGQSRDKTHRQTVELINAFLFRHWAGLTSSAP